MYLVTRPDVVTLVTLLSPPVTQMLPSGPAVIDPGWVPGGRGNSKMLPEVVTFAILFAASSTNQRLPSGPRAMPPGRLSAVRVGNSVIALMTAGVGLGCAGLDDVGACWVQAASNIAPRIAWAGFMERRTPDAQLAFRLADRSPEGECCQTT